MEVLHSVLAILGPYIAFGFGVFLADRLALYPGMKRWMIYLTAIPVGFVTVSTMLMGVTVTVSVEHTTGSAVEKYYGHTESIPEYLLFMGTIIFFGTLAPEIFDLLRTRFRQQT